MPTIKKRKILSNYLAERWPETFNYNEPKPLDIGTREKILASTESEDEKKLLMTAINAYCRRLPYILSIINHTYRYDLNGNESQLITDKEKAHALQHQANVKAKRKIKLRNRQKQKKEKKTPLTNITK